MTVIAGGIKVQIQYRSDWSDILIEIFVPGSMQSSYRLLECPRPQGNEHGSQSPFSSMVLVSVPPPPPPTPPPTPQKNLKEFASHWSFQSVVYDSLVAEVGCVGSKGTYIKCHSNLQHVPFSELHTANTCSRGRTNKVACLIPYIPQQTLCMRKWTDSRDWTLGWKSECSIIEGIST